MGEGWQPIGSAPRDGGEVLCCWAGCAELRLLIWKTNQRIVDAHARGFSKELAQDYFGDPNEMDDYELAEEGKGPTHWLPLPTTPKQEE